jgi:hypothetical protein
MPRFRTGTVTEQIEERRGLQRVLVAMEPDGSVERAYVLTQLVGPVAVGDRVVVNTTAVELGLGTGGWHVVHWNLTRDEWDGPGPGHIMKLRYTSLQADTGAAEETVGDLPTNLGGLEVVVCTLHSQVGVVAAAIAAARPGTRVAYVMTDGAALPIALSDLVAQLVERGLLRHTITAGHAFGGDLEAVTVPSALTLARHHLGAEVAIVGMGPGVVGTGTRLGTTAIEAASICDIVRALGQDPILCPRLSDGDGRDRHRGLSHHTVTVLELAGPVLVPWPADVAVDPEVTGPVVPVEVGDVDAMLSTVDLRITTMGRGPAEDPMFFRAAAAAGTLAARRCDGPPELRPADGAAQ